MLVQKRKGFMFLSTVLVCLLLTLLGASVFIINSSQFNVLAAADVSRTARDLCDIEEDRLRLLSYEELSKGEHSKQDVNINGYDGWQSEIILGEEQNLSEDDEDNKMRIATIKVYRNNEIQPRYSTQLPLTTASSGGDGTPIGTIIMRPTDKWKSESEKKNIFSAMVASSVRQNTQNYMLF